MARQFRFRQVYYSYISLCDVCTLLHDSAFYVYFSFFCACFALTSIHAELKKTDDSFSQSKLASRAETRAFREGKNRTFEARAATRRKTAGETKGWRCSYCTADRSAANRPLRPPPGPVPDDETWKLENVSCISCRARGLGDLARRKSNSRRQDYMRKYIGR